jgi:mucin-19
MATGHVIRIKDQEWKPLKKLFIKNSGAWVEPAAAWVKNNGVWEQVYPTPAASVSLSSNSLDFSVYKTTTSSSKRIIITNTGTDTLTINRIDTIGDSYFTFNIDTSSWGTTGSTTIAVGSSKYVDVSVTGNNTGSGTGSLILVSDIGILGSSNIIVPVTVTTTSLWAAISCTSTVSLRYDQPRPSAVQSLISLTNSWSKLLGSFFGRGFSGPTSLTAPSAPPMPSSTFVIKNPGPDTLIISSISVDDNVYDFGNWNSKIGPGASQTITATLTQAAATQYLSLNAFNDTPSITISGTTASNQTVVSTFVLPTTLKIVPHGERFISSNETWTAPPGLDNPVSFTLVGAQGGQGGNDSNPGGVGTSGGAYSLDVTIPVGTVVQVFPGGNGASGLSGVRGYGGGAGGINAAGFGNGGAGSAAGTSGTSGGGGGGGAATIVRMYAPGYPVSTIEVLGQIYAAGGGGGGGGGNQTSAAAGRPGFFQQSNQIVGERDGTTGQYKSGDGGGAGGGGGGFMAGAGGSVFAGDVGGGGGNSGRNGVEGTVVTQGKVSVLTSGQAPAGTNASVTIKW